MPLARRLGHAAPDVYPIGLGAMPLSIAGRPDEPRSIRTIHAALDAGVTLIDTADVYCLDDRDIGHNERLVARALASYAGNRDRVIVATKGGGLIRPQGRWERDARPARLQAACEASLAALAVPRIDLYQLHAPDPKVPWADSVGALEELRRAGKIRWVGLSNVSVGEIRAAQKITRVTTVQNRFGPHFRAGALDGTIRFCAEQGIGFLAYSPLGAREGARGLARHPEACRIGRRHDASPHAVVLAWILAQSPAILPIPGASTPEHAADSARAARIALSGKELAAIDAAPFPG